LKEEGRGKKEEGRGKKEEGRRKREEGIACYHALPGNADSEALPPDLATYRIEDCRRCLSY
jgi:hypothetical protein